MSTKSSSQGKEVSSKEGYIKKAVKYEPNQRKLVSFFSHTIFNKQLILGSIDESKRAMGYIMDILKIKKIKMRPTFIEIVVKQDNKSIEKKTKIKQGLTEESQTRYGKQFEFLNCKLSSQYQEFKTNLLFNSQEFYYERFVQEVKKLQHRNFICWFIPLGQNATQVKSIAISHKTLTLLGYNPQQASLELSNYKSNNFNFLSNQAYFELFWIFSHSLQKFMGVEINSYSSYSQVVNQSIHTLSNELIGRNQRRIKVDMKVWMASPFTLCMEIITITKGQKLYDQALDASRKCIEDKVGSQIMDNMSHVIKFPKPTQMERTCKRCSYVMSSNVIE